MNKTVNTKQDAKYEIDLGHVEIDGEKAWVSIEVDLARDKQDRLCLSISGSITRHSWGQVRESIEANVKNFDDPKRVQRICDIWRRYHLNDMHAGTPAQEAILHAYRDEYDKAKAEGVDHYRWACRLLERFKMLEVDGYTYGSAWLYEEIPEEVIKEIRSGL